MKWLALIAVLAACEKDDRKPVPPPPPPPPPPPAPLDIMLVLDMSKSMEETDLVRDRYDAAQAGMHQFIAASPRDRIGLVGFGQQAKLLVPLSADLKTLSARIDKIYIGDVPELGTAIGDGLALGIEQLQSSKHAAIVLLGDGDNNWVTRYDPQQAAALAKQAHIPVYTILVGNEDPSYGGMATDPKELTAIAAATGGTFARAPSREALLQDLAAVRTALDRVQ